jgi:predicted DNA-binding transcriptional regulator AlpA
MSKQLSNTPLPQSGFYRLPQVLALIPVSKSTWWDGVKSGRFPKPVKLSARTTAWRVEDIRALIDQLATERAA